MLCLGHEVSSCCEGLRPLAEIPVNSCRQGREGERLATEGLSIGYLGLRLVVAQDESHKLGHAIAMVVWWAEGVFVD